MSSEVILSGGSTRFGTSDPAELIKAALVERENDLGRLLWKISDGEQEIERDKARAEIAAADIEQLEMALSVLWTGGIRL